MRISHGIVVSFRLSVSIMTAFILFGMIANNTFAQSLHDIVGQGLWYGNCETECEKKFGRDFPADEYCMYVWHRKNLPPVDMRYMCFDPKNPRSYVPGSGPCWNLWLNLENSLKEWFERQKEYTEHSLDPKEIRGDCDRHIKSIKSQIKRFEEVSRFKHPLPEMEAAISRREIYELEKKIGRMEKAYLSAVKKAYQGVKASEDAYERCEAYLPSDHLKLDAEDLDWLERCDAKTLVKVLDQNSQTMDRYLNFKKEEADIRKQYDQAMDALMNCRPGNEIDISGYTLLETCNSHWPSLARDVNKKVKLMNDALDEAKPYIENGKQALNNCNGLGQARADLKKVGTFVIFDWNQCDIINVAEELIFRIDKLREEFAKQQQKIENHLTQAEDNLKYCEWGPLNERISQARKNLADPACWEEFPSFSRLSRRIDDVEKRAKQRHDEVRWREAKITTLLAHVRQYVKSSQKTTKPLEENRKALEELIRDAKEHGYVDCMLDLIAQAKDILKRVDEKPTETACPTPVPKEATHHEGDFIEYWSMPRGALVGPYRKWYDKERTKPKLLRCYNTEGKLHGPDIYWLVNGQKKFHDNYKDGKMHGLFRRWYEENGQLMWEVEWKDNKRDGIHKSYAKNGNPSMDETYEDGKLVKAIFHDADGKPREIRKGTFRGDRIITGTIIKFFKDGQPRSYNKYKDGKRDGEWKTWYEQPYIIISIIKYTEGKCDGIYKKWWTDGRPSIDDFYVNGDLRKRTRFDSKGKATVVETWSNGKLVSSTKVEAGKEQ